MTGRPTERQTRRLQKTGGSTYTVSLPKEWATEHRMEAGTEVHLYPHADGTLVVRNAARNDAALTERAVDASGLDGPATARAVAAAYAVGYERITVAGDGITADQRQAVERTVGELVGTTVTAEGSDELAVEVLLDASEVSIRQSVNRVRSTALSAHRDAAEALREGGDADHVRERAGEAGRLVAMVARHLNRSLASFAEVDRLGTGRAALFDAYLTAWHLERAAGHAAWLATLAGRAGGPAPEGIAAELPAITEDTRDAVDGATTAVFERDAGAARHAAAQGDAAAEAATALDRAAAERLAPSSPHARAPAALRRTAACGTQIAEVALRAAARPRE